MNSGKLGKFSECVRFVAIGVLAEVSEQQIYLGFPIPDKTYHKLWLAIAVCDHQPPQSDTRHQRQNLKTPQTSKRASQENQTRCPAGTMEVGVTTEREGCST